MTALGSALPFAARSTNVRSSDFVGDEDNPGVERDRNEFQKLDRRLNRTKTAERLSLHGAGWRHSARVRMVCTEGPFRELAAPRRSLNALERSH